MWRYLVMLACGALCANDRYDVILTDIEGTTTSISFVHDTLFPYARSNMLSFLSNHRGEREIEAIIYSAQQISKIEGGSTEEIAELFVGWIDEDKKITPLKTLQGIMWQYGYERGDFLGHVYPDAFSGLHRFKEMGMRLCVYSSGSVQAQKLLFSHSCFGDMTPLFSDYFDTSVGGKKERSSYEKIASILHVPSKRILFLSDSIEEIEAAKQAGCSTVLVNRENKSEHSGAHFVLSFDEIIP